MHARWWRRSWGLHGNARVEVLQQSRDAQGIPSAAQNRLLAKLAPMHREIVDPP